MSKIIANLGGSFDDLDEATAARLCFADGLLEEFEAEGIRHLEYYLPVEEAEALKAMSAFLMAALLLGQEGGGELAKAGSDLAIYLASLALALRERRQS